MKSLEGTTRAWPPTGGVAPCDPAHDTVLTCSRLPGAAENPARVGFRVTRGKLARPLRSHRHVQREMSPDSPDLKSAGRLGRKPLPSEFGRSQTDRKTLHSTLQNKMEFSGNVNDSGTGWLIPGICVTETCAPARCLKHLGVTQSGQDTSPGMAHLGAHASSCPTLSPRHRCRNVKHPFPGWAWP